MQSAPKLLSSWKICLVAIPLAFQEIHVSTVVAAHWMSPEAMARCRSFCGIFLIVTSRPFFLKMPAWFASVSGANPVHPEIPMPTFTSWATAGADTKRAAVATNIPKLRMAVSSLLFHRLLALRLFKPVRAILHELCRLHACRYPSLAALEAGNQFVGLARIEQAHRSQRPCATPGVPLDHETGGADRNVQGSRGRRISHDCADRVLGLGPWNMMEQPRPGRFDCKIRGGGFGHRIEIDESVLDGEWDAIGAVAAGYRDHFSGFPHPKAGAVAGVCDAARALDQLIA